MMRSKLLALLMSGALSAGAVAQSAAPVLPIADLPPDAWSARILFLHNIERARVGSGLVTWDAALAAGAQSWATYLSASGRLEHSQRKLRPGVGENLAMSPGAVHSVDALVGLWIAEKRDFMPGIFPANSRTGNWVAVSHYTQMIWPTTTRIGCAEASSRGRHYLVCRYSPKGNADGRAVPTARPLAR